MFIIGVLLINMKLTRNRRMVSCIYGFILSFFILWFFHMIFHSMWCGQILFDIPLCTYVCLIILFDVLPLHGNLGVVWTTEEFILSTFIELYLHKEGHEKVDCRYFLIIGCCCCCGSNKCIKIYHFITFIYHKGC